MERISLRAPAKVNIRLDVLGKRPDGYHEIKTWIYPISLADELHIEKVNTTKIIISSAHPELPLGEENLAYRAAALFMKERGLSGGVKIEIIKRIPLAAGLGGGSSDAAAVLKGMNILWGANVPPDGLMEIGVKIGADVPFFILGKGAIMGGKGVRVVKFLPPLKAWMVLINPGLPLSTQQVYQQGKWGLTKEGGDNRILMPPQDLKKMGDFLHNDLEGPALELMPIIENIKGRLHEAGASGVLMTGSGPTVFGLFRSEAEARRATRDLKMEEEWICFVAHTLSDS
ncbi:MAG: 4-(cytidine 5'-diphospho)-2-C-methyl-D-erythritol kinase [Deltaproteobacteria bacterium RBG_13_52_11]|nr:MAG: 4-(cytidine 5'-diphospho)-2-C-methyl-D-erythritol kinase [Deltaproteobacteria bacterium RBG_13_52_11]